MSIPSKQVLRTTHVYSAVEVKLVWQSAGEFLFAFSKKRNAKKGQAQSHYEVFRIKEKGEIPVESADFMEAVCLVSSFGLFVFLSF
jgi:translation initiation factor 3 subunit B